MNRHALVYVAMLALVPAVVLAAAALTPTEIKPSAPARHSPPPVGRSGHTFVFKRWQRDASPRGQPTLTSGVGG